MPDTKITALTALTAADPANDVLPIVDVSDTTMAASGTTKKISINNILACSPSATLASATITGDLTVDTNVFKVDTTSNQVGIGTASPSYAADISIASVDGLRVKNTLATSAYFNRFHISNNTGINFIGYGSSFVGGTILGLGAGSNSIFSDAAAPFGIATTVNQPLVFGINGSTAMTLNSTGLGVGVTPSVRFDSLVADATESARFRAASGWLRIHPYLNATDVCRLQSVNNTNTGLQNLTLEGFSLRFNTNSGVAMIIDNLMNTVSNVNSAVPSLGTNNTMVFNLTSNTNLRISVRGSDGTTRTANITLA